MVKNRMGVPEEYEPVLPGKVKAWIAKKKAQAEADGKIIYYQCVDLPNFWSRDGHKSYKQPGVSAIDAVLSNTENEGALMIPFQQETTFTIQDSTMVPHRGDDGQDHN